MSMNTNRDAPSAKREILLRQVPLLEKLGLGKCWRAAVRMLLVLAGIAALCGAAGLAVSTGFLFFHGQAGRAAWLPREVAYGLPHDWFAGAYLMACAWGIASGVRVWRRAGRGIRRDKGADVGALWRQSPESAWVLWIMSIALAVTVFFAVLFAASAVYALHVYGDVGTMLATGAGALAALEVTIRLVSAIGATIGVRCNAAFPERTMGVLAISLSLCLTGWLVCHAGMRLSHRLPACAAHTEVPTTLVGYQRSKNWIVRRFVCRYGYTRDTSLRGCLSAKRTRAAIGPFAAAEPFRLLGHRTVPNRDWGGGAGRVVFDYALPTCSESRRHPR